MNDDWRLRIDLRERSRALELARRLEAAELEHQVQSTFGDRVIVSRDESEVFCYTGSREQAERAQEWIATLAAREGWQIQDELRRWHPIAETWEDPGQPLPASESERRAEHEELIAREREEVSAAGVPDFEVRVQCQSHAEASALADRLSAEGIPHVRRWHYVVMGASDEDAARALAERVQAEAPPGSIVRTEGTEHMVWASRPSNPFSIFGGAGG